MTPTKTISRRPAAALAGVGRLSGSGGPRPIPETKTKTKKRARAREGTRIRQPLSEYMDQLRLPLEAPDPEPGLTVYRRREDREIRITAAMCGMRPERFARALSGVSIGRLNR